MSDVPLRWRLCRYITKRTGIVNRYDIRNRSTGRYMGTWFALCAAEAWFDFCHEASFDQDACGVRSDWRIRRL